MQLRYLSAILLVSAVLRAQTNSGELRLHVDDLTGRSITQADVTLRSAANEYAVALKTDALGNLDLEHLPYGVYRLQINSPGFAAFTSSVVINSPIAFIRSISMQITPLQQTVAVTGTGLNPEHAGNVDEVGPTAIQNRLGSIPGRSLQDLINSQPGWLYEGNAVLHPRGSEYQTQFVIDGVPLTDNRSPSFGPEIGVDNVQSLAIYTAGIPAEYGRKMGGVVEVNTQHNLPHGFHGDATLAGGSFATTSAYARGQYTTSKNIIGGSASGGMTDHYLNPVVPQNYSNTGTLGDFAAFYQRDLTHSDRLNLDVRHEISRYDIPNEQVQQAAGQRQTADNIETMGIASFVHTFSSDTMLTVNYMARDNASDFISNPQSTPIEVFQHNGFRENYFKTSAVAARGWNEWKFGIESDNILLHENTSYNITDPTQFDDETPQTFSFAGSDADLEQSAFVEDTMHLGNWLIRPGLRYDHYQLLLNRHAVSPRLAVSRYLPSSGTMLHFSYDHVFQTPSFENILLSSSTQVESLAPDTFLRLPVQPSSGDYYEAGVSQQLHAATFTANYFRRVVSNFADDDQIQNTTISFPIAFRKSIIYGAEAKFLLAPWHRLSGFASYSYQVGNVWNPVTGGLFLGGDAAAAETDLTGHFPDTQDQRHTVRGRLFYQAAPRLWFAGGVQYGTGLPFQFDGDPNTALTEYGPAVLSRINFDRGRIDPTYLVNASASLDLYRRENTTLRLQADGQNLNNVLDVIDFGGLFSGNAIGPPRSCMLRLTATF